MTAKSFTPVSFEWTQLSAFTDSKLPNLGMYVTGGMIKSNGTTSLPNYVINEWPLN